MEDIQYIQPREIARMGADIVLPKVLDNKSFIIAFKKHDKVVAFLYFTQYEDFIHINYSFTSVSYRKLGLSSSLRKFLIEYAKIKNILKIISVPFENANSVSILKTLSFIKDKNNDSYVLSL